MTPKSASIARYVRTNMLDLEKAFQSTREVARLSNSQKKATQQ